VPASAITTMRTTIASWRDVDPDAPAPAYPRSALLAFAAVVAVAFAALVWLVPSGFLNGDAPVYADRIDNLALSHTTVHIGYYLVGIVFTRMVPVSTPLALNLLGVVCGALSAGVVSSIAYTITRKTSASIVASAALLCLPVFALNALFAEIYVVQLVFFLAAVQFTLLGRPVAAGLSFALAILVTPSTVLAAPFFILLRPRARFVLIAAAAAAVPTAAIVLPGLRDYLWGDFGLLRLQARNVTPFSAPGKELTELGGVWALLLLAFSGIGVWTLAASAKRRHLAWAIGALWLVTVLVGERYTDVPVQLPLYAMLAVAAGIGVARLLHPWPGSRAAPAVAVCLFAASVVAIGANSVSTAQQMKQLANTFYSEVASMRGQTLRGDAVIAKWPTDRIAKYYLNDRPYLEWLNYEVLVASQETEAKAAEWARVEKVVAEGRRLWLIDTPKANEY